MKDNLNYFKWCFNTIHTEINKLHAQTYTVALNQSSYSSNVMSGSGNSLK